MVSVSGEGIDDPDDHADDEGDDNGPDESLAVIDLTGGVTGGVRLLDPCRLDGQQDEPDDDDDDDEHQDGPGEVAAISFVVVHSTHLGTRRKATKGSCSGHYQCVF